ncbi:uncharacterized protein LOC134837907 [Culicoides brevitarsis]|uniref:uncharacterized protein LOC134837907 n=1 Tax=Culicoides brevitarsis TaxID=469753 RepID=UPI00307C792F
MSNGVCVKNVTVDPIVHQNCVIEATPVPEQIVNCPIGSYLSNGKCISVHVRIICPDGSPLMGDHCVVRVPAPDPVFVEIRCPPNTHHDIVRNVCIYKPSPLNLTFECPPNTEKRENVCVMRPVSVNFRCSDGSLPVNGYCTISVDSSVEIRCPFGSRMENGVCVVEPSMPKILYICPDGSFAVNGICKVGSAAIDVDVEVECPEGFKKVNATRCEKKLTSIIDPPTIDFNCPPDSERYGNICRMQFRGQIPSFRVNCPDGSRQVNENTCVYDVPHADFEFRCPHPFVKVGNNKCVHTISTNNCNEKHEFFGEECSETPSENGNEHLIHNNNTVHAPTNITSTNIHHINISTNDCGNGAKERVMVVNGKTERIPCPTVTQPKVVPQPIPVVHQPMMIPQPMMVTQPCTPCGFAPNSDCIQTCDY